tara:strand:+ start:821 stop:967 length:147 start_codon:yes stop_codon:yes gene_type:complete
MSDKKETSRAATRREQRLLKEMESIRERKLQEKRQRELDKLANDPLYW